MPKNIVIAYHARTDKHGWSEICRYPLESEEWSKQDRVFIDELLKHGEWVLTCGWSMWQIVKGS